MAKRTFLMLAHTYEPGAVIGGFYASRKLDGMRCYWDGGLTRGLPCSEVPFANVEKDARYLTQPLSTGLWTRYGKSIQAPSWWLDRLPPVPLDGELYMGRGSFQALISAAKRLNPGPEWSQIRYFVFDMPPPYAIYGDGTINETNFKKKFVDMIPELQKLGSMPTIRALPFRETYQELLKLEQNTVLRVLTQEELPYAEGMAKERVFKFLNEELGMGGEGLILRHPCSFWTTNRTRTLLKVKGLRDAEATVTGYVWGRETALGSKLLGMMGALVLDFRGKRLELSGFTDEERGLYYENGVSAAPVGRIYPGKDVVNEITNPRFPRGSVVTFLYRELTVDGLPKEARYYRKRNDE